MILQVPHPPPRIPRPPSESCGECAEIRKIISNLREPIRSMYGIYTYIWLIFMINVGKYTSPMDPMGKNFTFPPKFLTWLAWQITIFELGDHILKVLEFSHGDIFYFFQGEKTNILVPQTNWRFGADDFFPLGAFFQLPCYFFGGVRSWTGTSEWSNLRPRKKYTTNKKAL